MAGLDREMLEMTLDAIGEFAARELPETLLIDLDERDEFPEELVRRMCGDELGIQLLFVPYEYGGMGGGAFDVYRVCERMAAHRPRPRDLGARDVPRQRPDRGRRARRSRSASGMGRIAKEGVLFAYGATEPEAGSDLGALKTIAEPVDGRTAPSPATGSAASKQWISNGGVADLYTILAIAPGGPSWFVVDAGTAGFTHGEPEDKHGIRLSNTAALFLDEVYVDADRLVGGVEGQGLVQAQQVFGYTRLMVAAFGLGAGWAALDRAIAYSRKRIQARRPAVGEAGLHAQADRPPRRRAGGGAGGDRGDRRAPRRGRGRAQRRGRDRQVPRHRGGRRRRRRRHPGPRRLRLHARLHGREDQARRPHHHDLRGHLRDHGDDDRPRALAGAPQDAAATTTTRRRASSRRSHAEHPDVGADIAALAHHALAEVLERCRVGRLTRHQHVLLRLGALIAPGRGRRRARPARAARGRRRAAATRRPRSRLRAEALAAVSRVYARERRADGRDRGGPLGGGRRRRRRLGDLEQRLGLAAIHRAQGGLLADMRRGRRRALRAQAPLTDRPANESRLNR